jgi:hypothetical protein
MLWIRIGLNADPDPAFYLKILNADPDIKNLRPICSKE